MHRSGAPFVARLAEWRAVPGGQRSDGSTVAEPGELIEARLVLGICERFGCLPSALDGEDAELARLLEIEARGTRKEVGEE